MLLGLVLADLGHDRAARPADAAGRPARSCAQVGALVEGPAAYGHLSGRANLRLLDAERPRRPAARAGPPARVDEALEQVGLGGVGRPAGQGVLARDAAAARAGRGAAAAARGCWCWTSRPTASTRRASARSATCWRELNAAGTTIFLSSHLLAEVEQLCTRVGVLDRGRLVLQEQLATLQAPTGRTVRAHPRRRVACVALLDGGVEARDGDRLVIRAADAAELNARLVAGGIRVARARRPSGGRWRTSCCERTGAARRPGATAADGDGAPMMRRRAGQAVPPAAHLGDDPAAQRAADPRRGLLAVTGVGAAARRGAGVPVRGAGQRVAVRRRGAGDRAAAVPAGGGRGRRRRLDRRRGAGRARCATCWSGRSGAPGCWSPSSSATSSSCWSRCSPWRRSAFVVGRLLLGHAADRRRRSSASRGRRSRPARSPWRTVLAIATSPSRCWAWRRWRVLLSTLTDSPLARGLGALAVPRRVLAAADARRRAALQPYLPTRYWLSFVDLFRDPILWRDVERGVGPAGGVRRRAARRRVGQLRHQGHHELSGGRQSVPAAAPSARVGPAARR